MKRNQNTQPFSRRNCVIKVKGILEFGIPSHFIHKSCRRIVNFWSITMQGTGLHARNANSIWICMKHGGLIRFSEDHVLIATV